MKTAAQLAFAVLLLSACNNKTTSIDKPMADQHDSIIVNEPTPTFPTTINWGEGDKAAVAYLGSFHTFADFKASKHYAEMADLFPMLKEFQAFNVDAAGDEVYLILPRKITHVIVWEYTMDMAAEGKLPDHKTSTPYYTTEKGNPILVKGNISDICPNMMVFLKGTGSEADLYFSPQLSLKDGRLSENPYILDCSPEFAFEIPTSSDLAVPAQEQHEFIEAYIVDSDETTNIREKPSGNVLMALSTQKKYILPLCEVQHKWWFICRPIQVIDSQRATNTITLGENGAWIHANVLAVDVKVRNRENGQLYESYDEKAKIAFSFNESTTFHPIDRQGEWIRLQTMDKQHAGWISIDHISANPQ